MWKGVALAGWVVSGVLGGVLIAQVSATRHLSSTAQDDSHRANQQTTASSEQCAARIRALGYLVPRESSTKPKGDANDRDYADLCQQIRMADAARNSADYGLWQLITSVASVVLLVFATGFAGLAWKESRVAAKAGLRSAEVAERALTGLERPYIFMEMQSFFPGSAGHLMDDMIVMGRPQFEMIFKNYGKSPAVDVMVDYSFGHLSHEPPGAEHLVVGTIRRAPISPSDFIGPLFPNVDLGLMPNDHDSIAAGHSFLWLYGIVKYRGMIGGSYETEFLWRYSGPSNHFGPYGAERNRRT